jgi:sirohydrochlorin ferrochelatase
MNRHANRTADNLIDSVVKRGPSKKHEGLYHHETNADIGVYLERASNSLNDALSDVGRLADTMEERSEGEDTEGMKIARKAIELRDTLEDAKKELSDLWKSAEKHFGKDDYFDKKFGKKG